MLIEVGWGMLWSGMIRMSFYNMLFIFNFFLDVLSVLLLYIFFNMNKGIEKYLENNMDMLSLFNSVIFMLGFYVF